jgi:hemoglobin-like flavoprotein
VHFVRGEIEMGLSTQQKQLVQTTFAKVVPIADTAAMLFYDRLFELDPSTRHMFKHDMAAQRKNLMQTLSVAVASLDRLEAIVPAIHALGKRHVQYGVTAAHYDTVGAALLWTLEQGLGADFTPEVKEAWATVYGLLAQVALEGAAEAEAELQPEAELVMA